MGYVRTIVVFGLPLLFVGGLILVIILLTRHEGRKAIKDSVVAIETDPLTRHVVDVARGMRPTYVVVTSEGIEFFTSQRVMAVKGDGAHVLHYALPHGKHMFELSGLSEDDLWDRIESDDGSPSERISFSEEAHANLDAKCAHRYKEDTDSQVSLFAKNLANILGGYRVFVLRDLVRDEFVPGSGRITGAVVRDNGAVDVSYDSGDGGYDHHQEDICAFIAREDVAGFVPDPRGYMASIAPELLLRKDGHLSSWGEKVRDPYVGGKKVIRDL